MMKPILALILLMSAFSPTFSEDGYTLKKLTEIALQNSTLIQAKLHEWKSFDGAIRQANAWQNPTLSTDMGLKSVDTANGLGYNISISQPFYFPGKQRLRGEIQETFKQGAKLNLEETKRFVYRQVLYLSYAYKEADHHAQYLEKRHQRFKVIQGYLASRPFASPQKKLEKSIVENRMLLLEKEILEVKNEKKTIWESLNLYLGFDAPVSIQAKWFSKGIELKSEILVNALKQNPELVIQDNALLRTGLQKSLAQKDVWPDFSLSAIYSEENTILTERFIGGGITVYLPLWNQNQGLVSQHESEISSQQSMISFLEKKYKAELNTLFIDYENKRSLIQKYPMSLIEDIHNQAAFADYEFRKGQIDILIYLESEQGLSDVHTAIFKSQLEYLDSYLKILAITGSMDFEEEK